MTNQCLREFAVYIPVGPSTLDIYRLKDLLASLFTYEPDTPFVILVDHGYRPREFCAIFAPYPRAEFCVIRHLVQTHNGNWLGAGCVSNLIVMNHIATRCHVDFVLKLDTDALVIRPFVHKLVQLFTSESDVGIVGTLGDSCNKNVRSYSADAASRAMFSELEWIGRSLRSGKELDNIYIVSWNLFTDIQIEGLKSVQQEISLLAESGFSGAHCQGGAYAVSRSFLTNMCNRGFFAKPERWLWLPVPEDRMMGMYSSLLNLRLRDFSDPGDTFGVQACGLAFSPEELVTREYSIIHSLRRNHAISEPMIRRWFGTRRSSEMQHH